MRNHTVGSAHEALAALELALRPLGSAAVSFSGGADSGLLLAVSARVLGARNVTAVTGVSPTYRPEELARASALAAELGVMHEVVKTSELDDPGFAANPTDRCYHCKSHLLDEVLRVAARDGRAEILDGTNVDDLRQHRPGMRAAEERGVRRPLVEAGLTKEDVRQLSRDLGLPTADVPSQACLASRFPYGQAITGDLLRQVAGAEDALHKLGLGPLRVRHYGVLARVELPIDQLPLAVGPLREKVVDALRALGWVYVTLDLACLRSGSMDEVLDGHRSDRS